MRGAIGRHPTDRKKMAINERNGKPAVTHYRVLERFGNYTYIECQLETGRTHQIRVHMASIGHPLLGDAVYGPKKCPVKNLQGQTLHAWYLDLSIHGPVPIWSLRRRFRNIFPICCCSFEKMSETA